MFYQRADYWDVTSKLDKLTDNHRFFATPSLDQSRPQLSWRGRCWTGLATDVIQVTTIRLTLSQNSSCTVCHFSSKTFLQSPTVLQCNWMRDDLAVVFGLCNIISWPVRIVVHMLHRAWGLITLLLDTTMRCISQTSLIVFTFPSVIYVSFL